MSQSKEEIEENVEPFQNSLLPKELSSQIRNKIFKYLWLTIIIILLIFIIVSGCFIFCSLSGKNTKTKNLVKQELKESFIDQYKKARIFLTTQNEENETGKDYDLIKRIVLLENRIEEINEKYEEKEKERDEEIKQLKEEYENIIKEQDTKIKTLTEELDSIKKWVKNNKEEIKEMSEIHSKIKIDSTKIDSNILETKQELNLIEERLFNEDRGKQEKKIKYNLLYRASRDGDDVASFHSKCDEIVPTLSIIETTKGYRFGAFTEQSWDGNEGKKDPNAFGFSLDHNKIYNGNLNAYIEADPSAGLRFGTFFFEIYDKAFENGGHTFCTSSFNYTFVAELTNGDEKFGVSEIEVYQITFE